MLHGALGATDKIVTPVIKGLRDGAGTSKLMQKRAAERYARLHQNNPLAMMEFVAKNIPKGANPIQEMARYQSSMEALLKENGWKFQ